MRVPYQDVDLQSHMTLYYVVKLFEVGDCCYRPPLFMLSFHHLFVTVGAMNSSTVMTIV